MKRTINKNTLPTLEEIKNFGEGTLSESQSQSILDQAADNPLLSEALEGYAQIPAYNSVPPVSQFLGATATTSAATSTGHTGFVWWSSKTLIAAAIVASATVAAVLIARHNNKQDATKIESPVETQNTASNFQETLSGAQEVFELNNAENSNNHDKPDATNPEIATDNGKGILPQDETTNQGIEKEIQAKSTADASTQLNNVQQKGTIKYKAGEVAVSTQYIDNHKVVDYTDLVNTQLTSFETELTGVPAPYANNEFMKQAEKENTFTTQVPYMEYIRQCLRALDQKKFELAISKFAIINSQYPEDVNAQFYTGYSYYEAGNFSKAIDWFDKTMSNAIWTFDESAEYYKAKSLKELGRTDEANTIFTRIADQGKFYSEMAKKELRP